MVSLHDVLVVCLCSICMCPSGSFGIEKAALYIKRDTFEIKKSTLALLNPQEVTLMECGHLCLDDNCCKGFMYNEISKHCVGLQFKDFDCTVNLNPTFSDIEGILPYQKGKLNVFSIFLDRKRDLYLICTYRMNFFFTPSDSSVGLIE